MLTRVLHDHHRPSVFKTTCLFQKFPRYFPLKLDIFLSSISTIHCHSPVQTPLNNNRSFTCTRNCNGTFTKAPLNEFTKAPYFYSHYKSSSLNEVCLNHATSSRPKCCKQEKSWYRGFRGLTMASKIEGYIGNASSNSFISAVFWTLLQTTEADLHAQIKRHRKTEGQP